MHPLYVLMLVLTQIWALLVAQAYTEMKKRLKLSTQWGAPKTIPSTAGVSSIQGRRKYMEDSYTCVDMSDEKNCSFYAVFDGHGGARTSAFAARKLHHVLARQDYRAHPESSLKKAFCAVDDEWLTLANEFGWDDGSTACAALVVNGTLYVANTGDSRAVLGSLEPDGSEWHIEAEEMSMDHKPALHRERQRIEAAGGRVVFSATTLRVEGILAVTRALGDRQLKKLVIPDPDVQRKVLNPYDWFLIIASDGVWDVMRNDEAMEIVEREILVKKHSLKEAADAVTNTAYRKDSRDNITTVVVDLRPHFKAHEAMKKELNVANNASGGVGSSSGASLVGVSSLPVGVSERGGGVGGLASGTSANPRVRTPIHLQQPHSVTPGPARVPFSSKSE